MTTRRDTSVQRSAKRRRAERDRCPECQRGSALRRDSDSWDDPDGTRVVLNIVVCRWRESGRCSYSSTSERRIDTPESTS
jgi:hypothetical protein